MKLISILILTTLACLVMCCKEPEKGESFSMHGYYPLSSKLPKTKLSEQGKKRALQVWDSIRPMLKADSTVSGVEYSNLVIDNRDDMFIWLSFDYDKTFGTASDLTFHMIPASSKVPTTYMYFGDSMVICRDKFTSGEYKDSVDIILDRALRRLVNGQGIRIDTDRGPTEKLSAKQIASLSRVLLAYEALGLANNEYNKTL